MPQVTPQKIQLRNTVAQYTAYNMPQVTPRQIQVRDSSEYRLQHATSHSKTNTGKG